MLARRQPAGDLLVRAAIAARPAGGSVIGTFRAPGISAVGIRSGCVEGVAWYAHPGTARRSRSSLALDPPTIRLMIVATGSRRVSLAWMQRAGRKSIITSTDQRVASRWRWTVWTGLGELIGFGLVGLLAFAMLVGGDEPSLRTLIAFSILAAVVEGGALAYAQWRALRTRVRVGYAAWALATIWPAALAYVAGMLLGPRVGTLGAPIALIIALAFAAALLLGALMGLGQWLVLRTRADRASWWIPANAIGWGIGLVAAVGGVSIASDASSVWMSVTVSVLAGLGMGATVGFVTSFAFLRLRPNGK